MQTLPVVSGLDLTRFITYPWTLYQTIPHSNWVPPLRFQERTLLQPHLHPFWDHAKRQLFIAKRGQTVVGRIAAIIDTTYNTSAKTPCGAFGFFECEDNRATANSLLDSATQWLAAQGMQYIRGPVNPSTNYTCGMLVDGFAKTPSLMMPWNPPYYPKLLEGWHAYKEQDLFAYRITKESYLRANPLPQPSNTLFSCRTSSKKTLEGDIAIMLDLYRKSWANNWYFTPLSPREEELLVQDLLTVVDTKYFLLFFHNNEPAGGMVALPNINPFLQAINGSLGLLTPWHYYKTHTQFTKNLRIMLFGILEQYRLLGLPALLVESMLAACQNNPDLQWVEGSWVLEDNTPMCDLLEDFGGEITMRYRIYRKEIV